METQVYWRDIVILAQSIFYAAVIHHQQTLDFVAFSSAVLLSPPSSFVVHAFHLRHLNCDMTARVRREPRACAVHTLTAPRLRLKLYWVSHNEGQRTRTKNRQRRLLPPLSYSVRGVTAL